MTNPEELERVFGGASPARRWVTGIVVCVLLIAGWLGARPAWRVLKAWRADHFMAEAQGFVEENQLSLAFERVRSALQLEPSRLDGLRLSARLQTQVGSETSLAAWQRVLDSGQATRDDRAAFLEAALAFERPDLAEAQVAQVAGSEPLGGRENRLVALYHLHRNEASEALRFARRAAESEPGNLTNAMFVASLLASDASPESRSEARGILWSVAERASGGGASVGLEWEALRRVGADELGGREDRERIVATLEKREHRSLREEIVLAETRMQLDPSQSDEIAAGLIALLPREDWEHLGLACEALLRRGRAADVVRLTGAGRGMVNRRLFMARHDALLATGEKEEAYRQLLQPDPPLGPFELELTRVRAAQELRDVRRRDAHLKDLLRTAGDHPVRVRRVAMLAEAGSSRDAIAVAEEAWTMLSARPGLAQEAHRSLQRLADRRGDTWNAREHARRARRAGADDDALKLDLAYLDLLLEEDPDAPLAEAERQMAKRPDDFHARAVAALAQLRRGQPAEARRILDRVNADPSSRPDALAVVVAAYGSNGLEVRARALAQRLPLSLLRPEERRLIAPWLVPPPVGAELLGVSR